MSQGITSYRNQIAEKLKDKEYRGAFVESRLATNIAAQINFTRESRGWNQAKLAKLTGMAQPRISLMEDPSYDKFTLSTLKRLAAAFDVALIVKFVPFSELLDWVINVSETNLAVVDFDHDHTLMPPAKSNRPSALTTEPRLWRNRNELFLDESRNRYSRNPFNQLAESAVSSEKDRDSDIKSHMKKPFRQIEPFSEHRI